VPTEDGGQPQGSWDSKKKHWDVDNGEGERTRYLPDGTLVDDNNIPVENQTPPAPFPGIDPDIVAAFGGFVIVVFAVMLIVAIFCPECDVALSAYLMW
jgi:hypothetical protein